MHQVRLDPCRGATGVCDSCAFPIVRGQEARWCSCGSCTADPVVTLDAACTAQPAPGLWLCIGLPAGTLADTGWLPDVPLILPVKHPLAVRIAARKGPLLHHHAPHVCQTVPAAWTADPASVLTADLPYFAPTALPAPREATR